jgi:hypothetical protein
MAVEPGFRIDRYQIEVMIGKDGMGEVYRASEGTRRSSFLNGRIGFPYWS